MKVLAIGATGKFAGLVVPALAARGVTVRALVHDAANTKPVRDLGAPETVPSDLHDPAVTFVDYRDLAGGRHRGSALMSRDAGRTVVAQDLDPDEALGSMSPGPMRERLRAMFPDYTAYGFCGGNNLVLRTILGRAPALARRLRPRPSPERSYRPTTPGDT